MKIKLQNRKCGAWFHWFAWYPVEVGGSLIWLERVERRWNQEINFRIIDAYDPGQYEGGWEYREPA